jgi:Xaa-Pro dipeptidase
VTIERSEDGYPRFSGAEMARRRDALASLMAARGVSHLVLYGANRSGSAIQWLTGWPVTREAAVVVSPGERDLLFVQFHNHVPNARRLACDADVRWGGPSTVRTVVEELGRRAARGATIGFAGPLTAPHRDALAGSFRALTRSGRSPT